MVETGLVSETFKHQDGWRKSLISDQWYNLNEEKTNMKQTTTDKQTDSRTVAGDNTYRGKAKDAYWRGYDAGLEHARYCDLSQDQYTEAYHDDTLGEILGEIVDGYRQYSPFEFTASEFNKARNSETLWEAYDKGEYDGWIDGLEKRFGKPSMD